MSTPALLTPSSSPVLAPVAPAPPDAPLSTRLREDLQLRGYAVRTQDSYVNAVMGLATFVGRPVEALATLTEAELRAYFLHLVGERHVARSTLTVYRGGVRFFVETTLGRTFPVLDLVRPAKRRVLPVVLTLAEVRLLLGLVRDPRARMCLTVIYSCGLRLSEGLQLRTTDVDSGRMLVRVQRGKGGQDRYVPLPARPLDLLRAYWRAWHRQPRRASWGAGGVRVPPPPSGWLFPRGRAGAARADEPAEALRRRGPREPAAEARLDPHAPALVRDAAAGGGRAPAGDPGGVRPPQPRDDGDLHAHYADDHQRPPRHGRHADGRAVRPIPGTTAARRHAGRRRRRAPLRAGVPGAV
ncbi:hypothetical protein tb265_32860 [Gemmatimonadetes bacterium T265]|nr:hypothetical protein tb265_32860 [Gemmatimonadetes bacterium T265]